MPQKYNTFIFGCPYIRIFICLFDLTNLGQTEFIKRSNGCGSELPFVSEPGESQKFYIYVNLSLIHI